MQVSERDDPEQALTGHMRRDIHAPKTRGACVEPKEKVVCSSLWSSTVTLPNTFLPGTAEPTSVEDVVNKDQCVQVVLGSD
jgi:hypothetical protein